MSTKLTPEQLSTFLEHQKQMQTWVTALEQKLVQIKALSQLTLQEQSVQEALQLVEGYRTAVHSTENFDFLVSTSDLVECLKASRDTSQIKAIKAGDYSWAQFLTPVPEGESSQDLHSAKDRWATLQQEGIGPSGTWESTGQRSLKFSIQEGMDGTTLIEFSRFLEQEIFPLILDIDFYEGERYKPFSVMEQSLFEYGSYLVGIRQTQEGVQWLITCTRYYRTSAVANGTTTEALIRYLAKHLYY